MGGVLHFELKLAPNKEEESKVVVLCQISSSYTQWCVVVALVCARSIVMSHFFPLSHFSHTTTGATSGQETQKEQQQFQKED